MSYEITKQKKAERLAAEKEKSYQQIFEHLEEGFSIQKVIKNEAGEVVDSRFIAVNEAAATAFGMPKEQLKGKLRSEILGPLNTKLFTIINQVVLHNQTARVEIYHTTIKKWVQITFYSPKPDYLAAFFIDISELKKYEQELKEINQHLELTVEERTQELLEYLHREKAVNRMKSAFISMASHELQTPMVAIKMCVEVLEKLNQTSNAVSRTEYLEYIKEETENILSMLKSFLTPDNLEIGALQSDWEEIDLLKFTKHLLNELNGICKEGQTIRATYSGKEMILLNKDIFRRVLLNLLSNAIKYSKKEINLNFQVQSGEIIIKVQDKGIGIPVSEQSKLFNQFFRAENAAHIQGAGLGLSIVKIYVDLMNGTIDFESQENVGTTFMVVLPVGNATSGNSDF